MKKFIKTAIYAIASIILTNCTIDQPEDIVNNDSEKLDIKITASIQSETRTEIGSITDSGNYSVIWNEYDEFALIEYVDGNFSQTAQARLMYCDDTNRKGFFYGQLDKVEGNYFDYYAYYPYNAYDNSTMTLNAAQLARKTSVDPTSMLLYGAMENVETQKYISLLDLKFKHLSAYAKMTITGLNVNNTVKYVKFSVDNRFIAGRFDVNSRNIIDGESDVTVYMYKCNYNLLNDFDVWFSTLPIDNIKSFTVEIATEENLYIKKFDVDRDDFALESGILSCFKVNMQNADIYDNRIPDNELHYTSYNDQIIIPTNTDFGGAQIISNTYKDHQGIIVFDQPLKEIGEEAFYCTDLIDIIIPKSVVSIGAEAFRGTKLININLPYGVKYIKDGAFMESLIENINIPESVISIGDRVFFHCDYLTKILYQKVLQSSVNKL